MKGAILVIHTAYLGDLVIASAFLRSLRKRNPDSKIIFLTTSQGREVLQNNPWNIEIRILDKRGIHSGWAGFWNIVKSLRQENIVEAYCLHRYLRSSLIARFSGARKVIGFSEAAGAFLYSKRVSRSKFDHESERYHALLPEYSRDDLAPELFFSESDRKLGEELLAPLAGAPFLVIAPSSAWLTKRWPVDRFAAVALWAWRKHKIRCVVVGSDSTLDKNLTGQLVHHFVHVTGGVKQLEGLPLNLGGRTDLGVLKYVLSRAKAVVANDSAPLHIGVAMGVPAVGVFGPTTKKLGFFPLGKDGQTDVAEVDLHCRPCGKHGHDRCPEAHFRCMNELLPPLVQMKLEKYLCP